MQKNILVLTGSPRKGGNSEQMADAFILGAEKAGHHVTKYAAAFEKSSGCRACETCWSKDVPCTFKDAFDEKFAPLYEQADVLVICAPLYYYNFPSGIQAVIEKTYAYLSPKCPVNIKLSESALLMCGGEKEQEAFSGAVGVYKQLCRGMNWQDKGIIIASGVLQKGEIAQTEYLKQSQELGERI